MATELDFIHIGLGKCMSSRLQGHWQLDDTCNSMSADGICNAIDDAIKNGFPNTDTIRVQCSQININFPPPTKSGAQILSSEGLTFSFAHNPELGEAIPIKDEIASGILSSLTDKILLLIRNPVDWIKSFHAQHVKEGGSVSMRDFVASHRSVILNNLNLNRRIDLWSRSGAEVVVLPIEIAKRDDNHFWEVYEKRLGISRPSNWQGNFDVVGSNTTSYETIEAHRRLNELLHLLEGSLERSDVPQKADMLKFMNATRKLCVRRAFSYSDEETLGKIHGTLQLKPSQTPLEKLPLDLQYLDAIETHFMEPLRKDRSLQEYGVLDSYALSLEEQRSKADLGNCA